MVGLSGIQMAFEYQTPFGIQTLLDHLNTRLVQYSDPHCAQFEHFKFHKNQRIVKCCFVNIATID